MRYFLFFIPLLISLAAQSQRSVQFIKTRHDWGDMISTQFPPAAFRFVNKGSHPLAILTTRSRFEVKVTYDRSYIAPGDTGMVYVRYESNQTGSFSEDVQVLFNTEERPVTITVTGNNVSVISCHPDPKNYRNREVRVIDAVTKDPIPNASCSFYSYNQDKTISFNCDKEGKKHADLPIGMYDIAIGAPGYYSYRTSTMVPKSAPIIFYELERSPYSTPPPAAKPVASPTRKAPEQIPNTTVPKKSHIKQTRIKPDTIIVAANDSTATKQVAINTDTIRKRDSLPATMFRSNNIVFLIDISNSMRINKKMDKLKNCMKTLANVLRDIDSLSLITYNYTSCTKLEAIAGNNHARIAAMIDSLVPFGLTEGVKGIETAYVIARKHFIEGGNNQVIFATDGEFTSGQVSEEDMKRMVAENARRGIIISTVSFGDMPEATDRLKEISRLGQGSFIQISKDEDKPTLLVEEVRSRCAK